MAVSSGGTSETKTVLTIDTTKSASSMKELRDQIKALKDQLVGLDKGTQEYSDTLVQLGEKQHEFREINEQVRMTNTDLGQTMSNLTNVLGGGVAAVQGMTSALSLMGVDMGDDNKLTQTLIKSMALLQSVSTMDKAVKSFAALTKVIKASIVATGGLGKALKALVSSNPIGLLLVAATALIGVITAIISKSKEMAKEATRALKDQMLEYFKQLTTWAQKFKQQLEEAIGVLKSGTSEEMAAYWDKNSQYMQDAAAQLANFRVHLYGLRKDYEKSMDPMKARYKAEQQYLQENAAAIINLQKQIEAEEAKSENVDQAKIKRLQAQIDQYTALNNLLLQEQSTWADVATQVSAVNSAVAAAGQMTEGEAEDLQAVYEPLLDNFLKLLDVVPGLNAEFTYWRKDGVKSVEDLQAALNQLYTNYDYIQKEFSKRGLFNMMSEQDQDRITQQFANTNARVAAAQRQAQKQRQQQYKDHLAKLLQEYNKHLEQRKKAADLARREEELAAKKANFESYSTEFDTRGVTGNSREIHEAVDNLTELQAVYQATVKQIREYIAADEEELASLEKIKSPTKEIKERIQALKDEIASYNLQLRENAQEYDENTRAANENIDALVREYQERENVAKALQQQIDLVKKQMGLNEQYAKGEHEGGMLGGTAYGVEDASWWNAFGDAGSAVMDIDKEIAQLNLDMEALVLEYQNLDGQRQRLEEQYQQGLITKAEYEAQMAEIELAQTENEQEQSEKRIQIAQQEAERKKAVQQNYLTFMSGMASAMTSVLDAIADQEDVSFEDQKKLKIASATISTLEGTIAGFMSGVNSGLPAPYNLILAAATATTVLTTGLLNIRKIAQTTKSNANASGASASGASKTVASPPEIVNLNAVNDEIELPDSRVYVVESDITNAQNRVQVVENNSTI